MAVYNIVEGTTEDLVFQLLLNGAPIDLTGISVVLLLEDNTGTSVSSPGTVSVVTPVLGTVKLAPTDATVFVPTTGPYYARWQLTDGSGKIGYVPTSIRDVWNIVGK